MDPTMDDLALVLWVYIKYSIICLMRIPDMWSLPRRGLVRYGPAIDPRRAPATTSAPVTPSRDITRLHRDHGGAAHARNRLPVGPGAEFRDHRALHDRGSLRGRGRDRARRSRRPDGRTRRSAAAGRLSTPAWPGARRLRFRRRGRGDHRQADPPPSACLRRRRRQDRATPSRACGSASRPRRRPSAARRAQAAPQTAHSPAFRSPCPR